MLDVLYILMLPFVEIGTSYWISFATPMLVLTILRFRGLLLPGLMARWPLLLVIPAMFLSLALQAHDGRQEALRVAREALFFVFMVAIPQGAARRATFFTSWRVILLFRLMLVALLVTCAVQFYVIAHGRYFGFPSNLYAQGGNTIATDLDLLWSKIRPAGPFSEPSYLGFILFSINFALTPTFGRRPISWLIPALSVVTGVLCQSAALFVFGSIYAASILLRDLNWGGRMLLGPILLIGLGGFLMFGPKVELVGRIGAGANDTSIFVRMIGPTEVLPTFIVQHPLGLPFDQLEPILLPYAKKHDTTPDQYTENGLYNMIFEFGIIAIPMLILVLSYTDMLVVIYILSAMFFSGGFFALDKCSVISFFVALYFFLKGQRQERLDEARELAPPEVIPGKRVISPSHLGAATN